MAETDTPNPILAMIDKAVEEKTFGLDALTAVQKIKEQAAKLDKDLTYARQSLDQQKRETERAQSDHRQAEEKIKTWETREAALIAREAKVTELEKQTAVANAQSGVYFNIIDKMFANRQFRETIMENATKPIANSMAGGYPISMPETRTITTDRSDVK